VSSFNKRIIPHVNAIDGKHQSSLFSKERLQSFLDTCCMKAGKRGNVVSHGNRKVEATPGGIRGGRTEKGWFGGEECPSKKTSDPSPRLEHQSSKIDSGTRPKKGKLTRPGARPGGKLLGGGGGWGGGVGGLRCTAQMGLAKSRKTS